MTGLTSRDTARIAVETVDWRRRVYAIYADVRAESDPAVAHTMWREARDELFRSHPATPLLPEDRDGFTGLPVADYDPAWRFELEIEPSEPADFAFETGTDGTVLYQRLGRVTLPVGTQPVGTQPVGDGADQADARPTLDVWRHTGYGGGLFVPVRDALSGRPGGTYGGGRYLLDTIKGADLGLDAAGGTLVVDLNFAYNPSCAYDPAWACPLAPVGNVVPVAIPVGETYG